MKIYRIPKGTEAVLLTMYDGGVVTTKPWKARENLEFSDDNLQIDPVRAANLKRPNEKSLGYQLAMKGYAIFIDEPGKVNKHALAVKYDFVEEL